MSDSLTLSECPQVFEAGAQSALATLGVRMTYSQASTSGGDSYAASFDQTLSLTRATYDASAAPAADKFYVVRNPCSGTLEIIPNVWTKAFPASFHNSVTYGTHPPANCSKSADALITLTLVYDGGFFQWSARVSLTNSECCASQCTNFLFYQGGELDTGSLAYDQWTMAEIGGNQTVTYTDALNGVTVGADYNP